MLSKVAKQDFAGETEDQGYDLSTSGRGEWTLVGNEREEYINPFDQAHLDWLKAWCRAHWLPLFRRSLVYGNKLSYHVCCNSFSRRCFLKMAGHPPLLSMSILHIPALRNASSYMHLYSWLLEVITESTRLGQKMLFPSLNRYHIERDEEVDKVNNIKQEEECMLAKRNIELENELHITKKQVQDLKKDNEKLMQSSKSWYKKYEELLETSQVYLWTPKKLKGVDFSGEN